MGLFDGFTKEAQLTFNTQKAIMTIVMAAVAADGEVSDEEVSRLRSMCARSPIFASNAKEEDDAVIDFAIKAVNQLKGDAIKKAAEALKPELRETAFAFATEMVMADGTVGQEEEAFIGQLTSTLGISNDLAKAVIQVTMMRMRSEK